MRKNSPRKWLHAVLDLLPVIIIPIFAIYSHRHTIDSYSVTREKYQVVDFNQLLNNSAFTYDNYGVEVECENNTYVFNGSNTQAWVGVRAFAVDLVQEHKYLNYYKPVADNITDGIYLQVNISGSYYLSNDVFQYNGGTYSIVLQVGTQNQVFDNTTFNCCLFDLTQMFGVGNEPTYQQFREMYPNDYYEYTLSKKELIQNGTETLNNNDIGSQLLYSLYNPIHDYMNFNNVFNFGEIYNWLQLNIFGGTAPLSVFIVWNIVLYEFLMDLIFLMYALFMFFIDFCTNLIDRFHCTCSGKR